MEDASNCYNRTDPSINGADRIPIIRLFAEAAYTNLFYVPNQLLEYSVSNFLEN